MRPPGLDHVCSLDVKLDPIQVMRNDRAGTRRIVPIVGGVVIGAKLQGAYFECQRGVANNLRGWHC